jgi:hypothetical protein
MGQPKLVQSDEKAAMAMSNASKHPTVSRMPSPPDSGLMIEAY